MKTAFYGSTHIGNIRPKNEDTLILKEVWNGSRILAVVIDGVGGMGGGDYAANLAARCISEHVSECPNPSNSIDVLQAAVIFANNSIYAQHNQMSCVLTAALIEPNTGIIDICHVGDTRMYMLKEGVLTKITSDHSLHRHIISRSVGNMMLQWGTKYIQTHTLKLEACTLLLCSDGLYNLVHSLRMVQILNEATSTEERTNKLINAALEAGGRDNVTVIVIDLKE